MEPERFETQYQEEIVRRTIVRRFDIAVGHCCDCHRRVQGRHPLQTSDAVGVGKVQLGRSRRCCGTKRVSGKWTHGRALLKPLACNF